MKMSRSYFVYVLVVIKVEWVHSVLVWLSARTIYSVLKKFSALLPKLYFFIFSYEWVHGFIESMEI